MKYRPSVSAALSQQVNKTATTTTAVVSSLNPSQVGQSITFTATVTPQYGGTPTGMVTFKRGTTILATGTLSGGSASFSTSSLAAGSNTITAAYGGDGKFLPSSGSVVQNVKKLATTTAVSSSQNPSAYTQAVTFTATVSGSPSDGEMVTFKNGSTVLGTASLSGGSASFSTSTLSAGSHSITALYPGDATLASSSGSLVQVVHKAGTTMTFSSKPNPSTVGQTVTFTAEVSSTAGTPTGTVTFKHGSTVLGTGLLDATGTATFSTDSLPVGSDGIAAFYGGSTNFSASSASFTQVVQ